MNGNPELNDKFTQIPNELLITLARAQMQGLITGRERSVIDFIIRNTYGYHKESNTLRTSFIAKELETTLSNISKILKRLEEKNIIIRDGSEITINKHYQEWRESKLPYHKSKLFRGKFANSSNIAISGNIANSGNKTLQSVATNIAISGNIEPEQKQLETEPVDVLNKTLKYNINKTIKREINIKERKITFNNQIFKFENIPKEKIEKWKEAYLYCNVDIEIKKMEAWLAANPERLKKNYEKFIVNWLSRTRPELVSGAKGEENGKNKGNNGRYIPITGKRKFTGLNADAGEW
jgi:phage replication O-like protein O